MKIVKKGNVQMNVKDWETSMWRAMRIASAENKYDILNLYIKLEAASKKYIESRAMEEGSKFKVPLENGTNLSISFYKDYSTVVAELPNGKTDVAVSKEDSFHKEYRYLDAVSSTLEISKLGIGPKASSEFHSMLANARVGDVFVFDKGKAYVCDTVFDKFRSFKETCGQTRSPKFNDIKNAEGFTVSIDDEASIQNAYREVKDNYTNDIKVGITSVSDSRLILNSLLANINETKELSLGPNKVVAQKNREGRGLVYFDETGKRVSEEQVLLMLSWLEAKPNQIDINRIGPSSPKEEFSDSMLMRTVDELLSSKRYKDAIDVVKGACITNGGVLELDMSSYVKKDGEYEAVSYAFKLNDEGEIDIQKILYDNNDFNKNIALVESVSEEDVVSYCEQKYDENFRYIKSVVIEECFEKYPQWHGEFFEKMVNKIAENKMREEKVFGANLKYASDDIAALSNIKFENSEEELDV